MRAATWSVLRRLCLAGTFGLLLGSADTALAGATGIPISCTRPRFALGGPLPLGSPGSAAIADFNSDGKPDLAFGAGRVVVLLGVGAGDFVPGPGYEGDQLYSKLGAGDFDEDGSPDVITTFADGPGILLGNGNGGFAPGDPIPPFALGGTPLSFAVGDFNGDGHLDFSALYDLAFQGALGIALGDGTGHFTASSTANGGFLPVSVSLADLNADGALDQIVVTQTGLEVLLGDGIGGFSQPSHYSAGPEPSSVAIGDFGGSSALDLAVSNRNANTFSILTGAGDGTFGPPAPTPTGGAPISIATGDWNSDGHADLAVENELSGDLYVYAGDGSGGFALLPIHFVATRTDRILAVGDVTLDGIPDIVTGGAVSSAVFAADGQGGFETAPIYPAGDAPTGIVVADLNGDGLLDLATAQPATDDVSVLLAQPGGGYAPPVHHAAGADALDLAAGDFNGDGRTDLAVSNSGSTTVSILLNAGGATFGAPVESLAGSSPKGVAAADFDGDGHLDLAVANYLNGRVSILLGNGAGGFAAPMENQVGGFAQYPIVADFNRDGLLDIAVSTGGGQGSSPVSVLIATGGGQFAQWADYPFGQNGRQVAAGDFNGDGAPDLAVALTEAYVVVLLNDGSGQFVPGQMLVIGEFLGDVGVADFDGDGYLDIAATNTDFGNFGIYRGDGAGGFVPAFGYGTGGPAPAVAIADLNLDGRPDLAFAGVGSDGVPVLLNAAFMVLPSGLPEGRVGQPYSVVFSPAGAVGAVTISQAGALPAGLAFDAPNRTITGTPQEEGSFPISVTALDTRGCPTTRHYVLVIGKVETVSAIELPGGPPVVGQPWVLRVRVDTVPPGAGTPTGTVTFLIDGVAQPPVALVDGVATLVVEGLAPGLHTITATYSGDGTFDTSAAPAVTQVVLASSIPTVSELGLAFLGLALAVIGWRFARPS